MRKACTILRNTQLLLFVKYTHTHANIVQQINNNCRQRLVSFPDPNNPSADRLQYPARDTASDSRWGC